MVSLIIVDYMTIEKTMNYIDQCLKKIICKNTLNIIIVDNNSDDSSIKYLNNLNIKQNKEIKYDMGSNNNIYYYTYKNRNLLLVKSNENLGYAKGNNLGAQVSRKIFNDKYYIFSNNDLKFVKKIILDEVLNIFTEKKNIGVIGPKIVGKDGTAQSPRKYNSIWKQLILYFPNILLKNMFFKYISNIDYSNESKYVYWVTGCFMIVDSEKFYQADMFDKNTFLYAEEMILSERLLRRGYRNYFFNEIELIHEHGQTIKNSFSIIRGLELSFNSNYYYYKQYIHSKKILLLLAKLSFNIFKLLFVFKSCIKESLKLTERRNK